jgi:DNA polymerase elongation subunit (family B)
MKFINIYEENNQVVIKTKEGTQHIDYKWYFCILTKDYLENKENVDDFWKNRKLVTDVVDEGTGWTRIYVDYPMKEQVSTWFGKFMPTFEADLRLWQRYLVDEDISLETDQSVLYFDIETDDLKKGIIPGDEQIVSIAAIGSDNKEYIFTSTTNEKKILSQFISVMEDYDILAGWFSEGFDLVAITRRCWENHLPFPCKISNWSAKDLGGLDSVRRQGKERARPEKFNHIDLMQKMKELHYRDTALIKKVRSFSLSAVSQVLLGKDKVDLGGKTIYALARENPELLQRYNLNDVRLVKELDEKLQIIKQKLIEHESCNARINDYTSHGRVDPFALRQARLRHLHLPSRPDREEVLEAYQEMTDRAALDGSDHGLKKKGDYIGGYVFDPEKGLHRHVKLFDFQSLYPSIIKTFNVSVDSYVGMNIPGEIILPSGACFSKTKKGIIPSIIQDLLDKRNEIRFIQMKKVPKDSPEYTNLHYRQYSFKVLANSMYGIMGANFSRYYKRECAEGITIVGQYLIKLVWDWFLSRGHHPIYGDTDSIFIIFGEEEDPTKVSTDIKAYLDQHLKEKFNINENHLILDFKEEYDRFISVAKKKYVGIVKGEIEMTGVEAKKRDTLPKAEQWQRELLDLLLKENHNLPFYVDWVKSKRTFVYAGSMEKPDLTFQKRLSREIDEYGKVNKAGRKSPIPAHVKVAAVIKEKNQASNEKLNLYSAGCYIPYIITGTKKGIHAVYAEDYIPGSYDKEYYWNACYSPCQRILESVYEGEDWDQYSEEEPAQKKLF